MAGGLGCYVDQGRGGGVEIYFKEEGEEEY